MHYYNFNIGDYIKHTMHLNPEEDLAYRRLLDLYYDTESPISIDIPRVSRRLRLGSEVIESVLNEFFEKTEDGYRNYRADAEIADYHAYIDKQRSNGKLGGRPKKSSGKPIANPRQSQTEPKKSLNNKQQTTNNKQQTIIKTLSAPDGVSPLTWSDFVQVRKAKKATITESAIKGIEREARKAGWSLEKALIECCARGWAGFKAEWVNKEQNQNKTQHQINQEGIARSLGLLPKDEYQSNVIEGEIYDAESTTTKRLG